MTTINLDVIQTVGLAVVVYAVGRFIKSKVKFFQTYFIPAPVIGGIICSLIIFAGVRSNYFTVKMNGVLQDFFMNIFFTGTGFTCSFAVLRKSGKLGAKLAVGAVLFLFVQTRECFRTPQAARCSYGLDLDVWRRRFRSIIRAYT